MDRTGSGLHDRFAWHANHKRNQTERSAICEDVFSRPSKKHIGKENKDKEKKERDR